MDLTSFPYYGIGPCVDELITFLFKYDVNINVEWTSTITKYLKDQLNKLNDYHQSYSRMTTETEIPQKQWHYTVRLTDWLYEVNLFCSMAVKNSKNECSFYSGMCEFVVFSLKFSI